VSNTFLKNFPPEMVTDTSAGPHCYPPRMAGMDAEPKRCAFWFSEFGAKPQTPKAKAAGFRQRKG
jgi:hypothetical protein